MPSEKTKTAAAVGAALPAIPKELIDQIVTGPMSAEAVNAASMAFKKALIYSRRVLRNASHSSIAHLRNAPKPSWRNATSAQAVQMDVRRLRAANWRTHEVQPRCPRPKHKERPLSFSANSPHSPATTSAGAALRQASADPDASRCLRRHHRALDRGRPQRTPRRFAAIPAAGSPCPPSATSRDCRLGSHPAGSLFRS